MDSNWTTQLDGKPQEPIFSLQAELAKKLACLNMSFVLELTYTARSACQFKD